MKKLLLLNMKILLTILTLSIGWISQAQTNSCSYSGTPLTVGNSCTYTPFNSTNSTDYWNLATGCNALDRDDAWWYFTATETSTTITYDPDLRDAILHLFTGSCSTSMSYLDCADNGGPGVAETISAYPTVIGVQYAIRIQRKDHNGNMFGWISVHSPADTLNNSTGATTETVCDTYTAPDGAVYTITGMYTAIVPNAAGCDSTITIDLTVNTSTTGSATETVCDTYTAPDGMIYTSTGMYTAIVPNSVGCDSTITIDLTVNNSTVSSVTETACDSYTAPDGTVYTSSGMYTAVIPNAVGCDSTITIDLTVNNATASSISETALDSYTAPSGAVYTTSGVFNDTIANAAGCDSVITITLTMNHTGIEELNHQQIILIPNPTSDFITIEGIENVTGIKGMELVSSTGRVVAELKVGTVKIDVSTLSSGTYFLSITHANGTERIRFVKE